MIHHNPHRLHQPSKSDLDNEIKLKEAYEEWRSTGVLTNDETVVKALYYKFKMISDISIAIPEYSLMAKDAHQNASRIHDIIVARYGKDVVKSL
jgi:hypothetical protein